MDHDTSPAAEEIRDNNQKNFSNVLLLIPTLNEEEAVGRLVVESKSSGFTNILVVDGFSTDRTREVAKKAAAQVMEQDFGKGKGCGVRTGMNVFLQSEANVLCIIDGDGTNIPSCLNEMISLVQRDRADVVLGSRTRGRRDPHSMNILSLASNLTVSFLLGAKFGRLFTDVQTGYWALTKNAVQKIYPRIRSTGFEIEMEMFVQSFKERLRVSEVPVRFRKRSGTTKFSFVLRLRNLYYAFKFLTT